MKSFKAINEVLDINKIEKFWLLIICMLSNIASLYCLYLVQEFIDNISTSFLGIYLLIKLLLVAIISYILNIVQMKKWQQFGLKTINSMRSILMTKTLKKHISFFNEKDTGDVTSSIMTDAAKVGEVIAIADLMLIINVFKLSIIFVVLLSKNKLIGFIEIIIAMIYLIIVTVVNRQIRDVSLQLADQNAKLNQVVLENIQSFKEIKMLKAESFFAKKFIDTINTSYYPIAILNIKCVIKSQAMQSFLRILFPIIILSLGGFFAGRGVMTIGTIILFYTYTEQMIEPLNNISDFYREYQGALGSLDRIKVFLEEQDYEEKTPTSSNEISLYINIKEFKRNNKTIFKNIHEKYVSGDIVFVSGESGSGKTTLFSLISGIEKSDETSICINNININNYTEDDLYNIIKIQFQNPTIPSGTLLENITLGNNYKMEEVEEVIQKVRLNSFEEEKGLNYFIKEQAKNISGGQKQRLAMARLLITKPKILLLDEVTNGLDAETERSLLQMIREYVLTEGAIVMMTSHNANIKEICNKELKIKKSVT